MADDKTLRMRHARLEPRRQEPGGRGGDDRVWAGRLLDTGEYPFLQVLALGQAFLDEVGVGDRVAERGGDRQAPLAQGDARKQGGVSAARVGERRLELARQIRIEVEDRHVVAVQEETGDPAAA